MNRHIDPPYIPITKQDITSYPNPNRHHPKPINPETTPHKLIKSQFNNYPNLQQQITSPLQKDQFLENFRRPAKPANSPITQEKLSFGKNRFPYQSKGKKVNIATTSQLLRQSQDPVIPISLSKSWTNHGSTQTMTYIQQIINDLSDRREFDIAKKYIPKLPNPHLRQKLQNIIVKLQGRDIGKASEIMVMRDILIKMLRLNFKYERSVELFSMERLVKELEKSVAQRYPAIQSTHESQSKEKVRELKEESRKLNSKLQAQKREMQIAIQTQKVRIRQKYQQIYLKIYQQNNKLRKQLEQKQIQLKHQHRTSQQTQTKYETILNQVSLQIQAIKSDYNKVIQQSKRQGQRASNLQAQLGQLAIKLKASEDRSKQIVATCGNYDNLTSKLLKSANKYQGEYVKIKIQPNKGKLEEDQERREGLRGEIKNNQEILLQQSQLIQRYQKYLSKIQKDIQTRQANLSFLNHKIQHNQKKLQQQLCKLAKIQAEASTQQQKHQELLKNTTNLHLKLEQSVTAFQQLTKNHQKKQNQFQILSNTTLLLQKKNVQFQRQTQQLQLFYQNLASSIEKSKQEKILIEKYKFGLQREIDVINEQIISKKERLIGIKNQQEKGLLMNSELEKESRRIKQEIQINQKINHDLLKERGKITLQMNTISINIQQIIEQKQGVLDEIEQLRGLNVNLISKIQGLTIEVQRKQSYLQRIMLEQQISLNNLTKEKNILLQSKDNYSSIDEQSQALQKIISSQQLQRDENEVILKIQKESISEKESQLSYILTQREEILSKGMDQANIIKENEQKIRQIHAKLKQLKQQYTDLQANRVQLQKILKQTKQQFDQQSKQLMKSKASFLEQIASNTSTIQHLTASITSMQAQQQSLVLSLANLKTQIKSSQLAYFSLQQQISDKKQQLLTVEKAFNSRIELAKSIESKLETLESSIDYFQYEGNHQQLQQEQVDLRSMRLEKDKILQDIQIVKKERDDLQEESLKIQTRIFQNKKILGKCETEVKIIEESLSLKYQELVTLQSQILMNRRENK